MLDSDFDVGDLIDDMCDEGPAIMPYFICFVIGIIVGGVLF